MEGLPPDSRRTCRMGHYVPHAGVVGMNLPLFQPLFSLRNVLVLELVHRGVLGLTPHGPPATSTLPRAVSASSGTCWTARCRCRSSVRSARGTDLGVRRIPHRRPQGNMGRADAYRAPAVTAGDRWQSRPVGALYAGRRSGNVDASQRRTWLGKLPSSAWANRLSIF